MGTVKVDGQTRQVFPAGTPHVAPIGGQLVEGVTGTVGGNQFALATNECVVIVTPAVVAVAFALMVNEVPLMIDATVVPPGMPAPVIGMPTAKPVVFDAVTVDSPVVMLPVTVPGGVPVHCATTKALWLKSRTSAQSRRSRRGKVKGLGRRGVECIMGLTVLVNRNWFPCPGRTGG
jgi:hypothetical protein